MELSPEKWETIKSLFEAALEEDSTRRSAFLEGRCPDATVRAEVERLLAEHDKAREFLSTPALANLAPKVEVPTEGLLEGTLLAGRFLVVRFIAGGGMGEVYEAEDQELRERVAIKTIRPEVLAQPNAVARFRREVHLARKVTHPNVCRIFDLFRHKPEATNLQDETVFISMELLNGKTLAAHLKQAGRLSETEALPMVRQMASALAAAHSVGVVHRDFKPGNVVLVHAAGQETLRPVVTDFGLAVQSLSSDDVASLSTGQGILGTPAYMAPEQLEGRPSTTASDIYAFGLVIYEMVTGARPFHGDTPASAALKRLSEPPTPPRQLQPGLSLPWETAILRCLERDPAKRFSSAEEVAAALLSERPASAADRAPRKGFALQLAAVLAVLLLIGIGIGYGVHRVRGRVQQTAPIITPRRSVAVLGFKNLGTPDADWISTALSEMFSTELAVGEKLRTIPGENVARARIDLSLPEADSYATPTLARIRKVLGADEVIVGSYLELASAANHPIRLDLRAQDCVVGDTMCAVSETGTEGNLLTLVSKAGAELRQHLGLGAVTAEEAATVQASFPSNAESAHLYSAGLEKLRNYDALAARDLFEKAIQSEPKFALAHAALAAALTQLDNDHEAVEESKKAVDLSGALSRSDQLSVSAIAAETAGNWDKAIEVYRTLWDFFPDEGGYGLRLANAQTRGGKGQEALTTLEALRKIPPQQADDPQIDIAEAYAAESLGDFPRERTAAERAREKATRDGSRLTVAAACMPEGWALLSLGQASQAFSVFQEAKQIYEAAGNRTGAAQALGNAAHALLLQGDLSGALSADREGVQYFREIGSQRNLAIILGNMALVLDQQGNIPAARKAREQSLAIHRQIGNKHGIQTQLNGLAMLSNEQGNVGQAQKEYEASLAVSKEIGDQQGIGTTLGNLGNIYLKKGAPQKAKPVYEQALQIRAAIGDKHGVAVEENSLGNLYLEEGDLPKAEECERKALAVGREIQETRQIANALTSLGNIQVQQGNLPAARKSYSEALSLWNEMGSSRNVLAAQESLAELSIEEGHLEEAVASLRQLHDQFVKQKDAEAQVGTDTNLALALWEEGLLEDAREEIVAARQPLPEVYDFKIRQNFEIVGARVTAGLGKPVDAARTVETALSEAKNQGLVSCEFSARLALGEIEMNSNKIAAGRARLDQLQKDATVKGFLLVARKAEAASKNYH